MLPPLRMPALLTAQSIAPNAFIVWRTIGPRSQYLDAMPVWEAHTERRVQVVEVLNKGIRGGGIFLVYEICL